MGGARVLVLIDGEPVPGGLLENRDLTRLSTVAVDRIEVVKGPLSAIYGSDALGGVINLITRAPARALTLEARVRAGDLGRRELQLGAEAGGTLSYRVTGGWREQTAVPSVERRPGALSRVWDARSTLRWAASGKFALRTDLSLLRERQRWQLSSDGFNGFNDNRGITGWLEATWLGEHSGARARILAEDYTHRFRQARADRPLASDNTPAQSERVFKGSLGWNRRLAGHSFDVGMDASHREIDSPGKLAGTTADQQIDGYVQDGWRIGELLLQPAGRLSWNSRWGTTLTPSVATAWEPASGWRLRLSVGRGFRGPSFKELAWDYPNVAAGYAIRGNPDLVPEQSWQTAAGGSWSRGSIAIDGEIYRNQIRNLIELVDAGPDLSTGLLLFTTRNVARARTEGFEWNLRWSGPAWQMAAGYGFLSARDLSTNSQLDRRARHQARLRIGRGFGPEYNRVHTSVTLVYTGSAPVTQIDGTPARQEAFLAPAAQVKVEVSPTVAVSAGVDNLFDARPANWTGNLGRRLYFGVSTRVTP
jgi:outer membrane receptor for ferrienterochelin and colicins